MPFDFKKNKNDYLSFLMSFYMQNTFFFKLYLVILNKQTHFLSSKIYDCLLRFNTNWL